MTGVHIFHYLERAFHAQMIPVIGNPQKEN